MASPNFMVSAGCWETQCSSCDFAAWWQLWPLQVPCGDSGGGGGALWGLHKDKLVFSVSLVLCCGLRTSRSQNGSVLTVETLEKHSALQSKGRLSALPPAGALCVSLRGSAEGPHLSAPARAPRLCGPLASPHNTSCST